MFGITKGQWCLCFLYQRIQKHQSEKKKNGNCFILHWSVSPKLIAVHCVSAVKSEVCTFECSHGADIILTLLWFSNSSSQSVFKLCFKAEKENKGYMLLWYKWYQFCWMLFCIKRSPYKLEFCWMSRTPDNLKYYVIARKYVWLQYQI